MKQNNRRRHYWINPSFQSRFLTRILILEVIVIMVTALLSLFLALLIVSPAIQTGPTWGGILTSFVLLTLVMGVLLVWLGIRVSHRICGPVHHIRQVLKSIREDGATRTIQLRNTDELQELAEDINATLDYLHTSQSPDAS